jgi:ABC-type phosphonate transport system ATPase subunit
MLKEHPTPLNIGRRGWLRFGVPLRALLRPMPELSAAKAWRWLRAVAREVADRVVFMDGGRIVESGTPDQVLSAPTHARTRDFISAVIA